MNEPMVRCEALEKSVALGDSVIRILKGVDLAIEAGESVAIVGASGSGKSTLLALLAGLDLPSAGRIWVAGVELSGLGEEARAALRRDRVGFVFQSFQLLPALTALENVMLPLELRGLDDPGIAARRYLEKVNLGDRLGHYPRQLSGGEQQRVAIARAFAGEPSLLFADEPTGNLDLDTGARVADLLFDLNHEAGTTLVLVTHDVALSRRCDRCLALVDGRIELAGRR